MNHLHSLASVTLIILFAAAPSLHGQDLSGIPAAFADIGLGLRPVGMGGAYSALAVDEHAARWNPSLLGDIRDPSAGFSWTSQFGQITYSYAAISYPIGKAGLGAGAYFLTAGDDIYSETTIGLAAGVNGSMIKLPDAFRLGTTVKIYLSSFGNDESGGVDRVTGSASGFGLDLAASWRFTDNFLIALIGRDLVNSVTWDSDNPDHSTDGSYTEGVPRVIAVGGAFQDDQIAISFDMQPSLNSEVLTRVGVGAEIVIWKAIKPRIGLSQNFGSGDPNRQISLGLGIDLAPSFTGPIKHIKFGYTHLLHDIASTPRVGLTIGW